MNRQKDGGVPAGGQAVNKSPPFCFFRCSYFVEAVKENTRRKEKGGGQRKDRFFHYCL